VKPYKIIIADDHMLIRQGIKSIIRQDASMMVIGEAGDGRELLALLRKKRPDMIILDIHMPEINGLEAVEIIAERYPHIRILILTMYDNCQFFFNAISSGAHGYLMKDDSDLELLNAIRVVKDNRTYVTPQLASEVTDEMISAYRDRKNLPIVQLTSREKQVLRLVVKGHTSKQMADMLCLSPRTIDHHRAKLLKKFKMKNTVDLVNHVLQNSIVVPD